MLLEEKIKKYTKFKELASTQSRSDILATLEVALLLQESYEKYSNMGLLEWDKLSEYRGTLNALSKASVETLAQRNQVDRELCKLWKPFHNKMWLFLEEPKEIKEEVHRLFEVVFGDISRKNHGIKALVTLLSKHNWHGVPSESSSEFKKWNDEKIQLESLTKQLKSSGLNLEVEALWDYYAPGYLNNKPTFNWLMSDILFAAIEKNEDYDLMVLDQILSGDYEPSAEELDLIYSEVNEQFTNTNSNSSNAIEDDYELEMLMDIEN